MSDYKLMSQYQNQLQKIQLTCARKAGRRLLAMKFVAVSEALLVFTDIGIWEMNRPGLKGEPAPQPQQGASLRPLRGARDHTPFSIYRCRDMGLRML